MTKMSLRDYVNYLNDKNIKNEDENEENSALTIAVEERLDKIDTLIKNNSKIKYNLKI